MAKNPACTVYIGNLDEKVSERILYEILVQVGHVVDLYIPRDKETNRHKGFAFAEYETEEIAGYAVKLFSGLVRLQNKTLKFAMSGQDKPSTSQSNGTPVTPKLNSPSIPKPSPVHTQGTLFQGSATPPVSHCRVSPGIIPHLSPVYPQASRDGLVNRGLVNSNFEYNRRVFGAMLNNASRPGARHPIAYPSY